MPVRDAAPWLAASLRSLTRQRVRDLEIVAVDDGSTDGSGAWLDRAAAAEPRLRVVHTPPLGLPAALATALALARAPLIARHDADDLSHRDRLALQHAYLAAHPRVSVVGCRVRLFPGAAAGAGMRRWAAWHNGLLTHEAMAREALIDSPLAHGTALLRRAALARAGGWQEHGWPEDLDLWLRMLGRVATRAIAASVSWTCVVPPSSAAWSTGRPGSPWSASAAAWPSGGRRWRAAAVTCGSSPPAGRRARRWSRSGPRSCWCSAPRRPAIAGARRLRRWGCASVPISYSWPDPYPSVLTRLCTFPIR